MKIHYDKEVDALYIKLSDDKPDGVIEISNDVNIDVTPEGRIIGIEILDSSKKIDLNTIFSYQIELDEELLRIE